MPSTMDVDNTQHDELDLGPFSPECLDPEKLMAAYLMHRVSKLSKEALADFASLASDIANCQSEQDFVGIAETIREILFPGEIIGELNQGAMGETTSTHLEQRKAWTGARIKELREQKGLNQTELAEKAGLTQSHISRLETGEHSPSNKTLTRIAKALDKSVGDLDPSED